MLQIRADAIVEHVERKLLQDSLLFRYADGGGETLATAAAYAFSVGDHQVSRTRCSSSGSILICRRQRLRCRPCLGNIGSRGA